MLIEFKVANYRSIRAEQTLSMVASNYSDELPQNLISCDHVPGLKGTKLVKAVALYGANASGKSNIVAALRFFAEFVRDSATKLQPGAPTGAQPFKLDPTCLAQPSKFEITAVINGIRTLYGIEMTRERVTSEYLVAYPKGRPQVWFERDWDAGKGKYVWSKSTTSFKHDAALREKTSENATFLGAAAHWNHGQSRSISSWLTNKLFVADLSRDLLTGAKLRVLLEGKESRALLTSILGVADLGALNITLRKSVRAEAAAQIIRSIAEHRELKVFQDAIDEDPPKDSISPTRRREILDTLADDLSTPELLHRGPGDSQVPLNFFGEESVGTQRFLELFGELYWATAEGVLLAIDEIEASLHPTLITELLRMIPRWKGHVPGAQLIFTTHNPLLLDQTLLRRDQIWFTEKDQEGATRLYPLTDFKPRKDESLVKGYLAGRYGGIPFIPEGLKF